MQMSEDETRRFEEPDPHESGLVVVRKPTRLRVIMPDNTEQTFSDLSPRLMIGRSTASGKLDIDIDLSPYDQGIYGVSRAHALIAPDHNQLVVKDLRSTNGTELNGESLRPMRSYVLQSGDKIKVANLKIQVFIEYDD